ncbi:MAG: glycosyltransferase family 4 protein [Flavobacteriales bacterium]|jgi:glycosyltransferase involved in cell wall biosynthesis|nr:glycosyltransferase family 4 protein [Flavobacteriales bacterium]
MHILLVSHEFAHPQLERAGGIGNFLADYAQRLVFEGHQVTVIGYNKIALDETWNGVQLKFFKSQFSGFYQQLARLFHKFNYSKGLIPFYAKDRYFLARKVKDFVEKNHVDIIEVNDYLGDGAFIEVEIPLVMRTHGSYRMLKHEVGLRNNDAFEYFEQEQIKKVNAVCSVSHFSAEKFCKYFDYPKDQVAIIHNGVDIPAENQKSSQTDSLSVFYFGTFSHAKGSDRLAEIIEQSKDLPIHFTLAGKPESAFKNFIEEKISTEAKKNINFLGYINHDQLETELQKSQVVLFPSRLENFSIALLEAMIYKNICIGWDIPSFKEVIISGENGFLVDSVEDCISLLKDYQKHQEIGQKARETVVKNYSKSKMIEKSIQFYISKL